MIKVREYLGASEDFKDKEQGELKELLSELGGDFYYSGHGEDFELGLESDGIERVSGCIGIGENAVTIRPLAVHLCGGQIEIEGDGISLYANDLFPGEVSKIIEAIGLAMPDNVDVLHY